MVERSRFPVSIKASCDGSTVAPFLGKGTPTISTAADGPAWKDIFTLQSSAGSAGPAASEHDTEVPAPSNSSSMVPERQAHGSSKFKLSPSADRRLVMSGFASTVPP